MKSVYDIGGMPNDATFFQGLLWVIGYSRQKRYFK